MTKRVLFLVGLPASGKSTFRDELVQRLLDNNALDQYVFVSSDDQIEALAEQRGVTYNDIFRDVEEEALVQMCMSRATDAFINGLVHQKYIVVDRTNMSVKSRQMFVALARKQGYECDALVFARPMTQAAHDEWNKRLDRPGKTIPNNVLQQMFQDYQRPTREEGFVNVVDTDTFA